ncbi:chromate resistance protein ChrB domain-containing protein [Ideonella livida]|uniref:Chromate resistance protein n=1 Tax=Ideonella livida TaxID=2707176 RepID=A0A7C9TMY0_9BURK|nr:chromate resistance protein ChrB domain-containing protein [Ideonella livida]NDY92026.1 chromate resistance protein [Ideonella livida]
MQTWLVLVTSLPTENATARMRAWRALKACGAAVLRDGVYLLPAQAACREALAPVAADVSAHGGSAWLLEAPTPEGADFTPLFDRTPDWATLQAEWQAELGTVDAAAAATAPGAAALQRQLRKLRRRLQALQAVDFFPGPAQAQALQHWHALEQACARALHPGEPAPADTALQALDRADFQGRTWATRRRPWVDRLASAWLIGRFIDAQPTLLWLAAPQDLPAGALGYDFDGARFSHTAQRVTFEVLVASFGLDHPGLPALCRLVHALDVGGPRPPEATGVERVLAGLRTALSDDNALLAAASPVFDGLLQAGAEAAEDAA